MSGNEARSACQAILGDKPRLTIGQKSDQKTNEWQVEAESCRWKLSIVLGKNKRDVGQKKRQEQRGQESGKNILRIATADQAVQRGTEGEEDLKNGLLMCEARVSAIARRRQGATQAESLQRCSIDGSSVCHWSSHNAAASGSEALWHPWADDKACHARRGIQNSMSCFFSARDQSDQV